jgi:peptide methionine sulfoxide reductase msrA/msrB
VSVWVISIVALLLSGCLPTAEAEFTPTRADAFERSDTEWRAQLTPEEFHVLREAGTERPWSSALNHNNEDGVYRCAGCGLPLYSSSDKFDSGTGWPSFSQAAAEDRVGVLVERSMGMDLTEILCNRCGGHLGHVFSDGPAPHGKRHCVNGDALEFVAGAPPGHAEAVFAGGCFWCLEADFDKVSGVLSTTSGFTGGPELAPAYKAVAGGRTGHVEAVKVVYDPGLVSYGQLLDLFWHNIDPTQDDGQFCDKGSQYRAALFPSTPEEAALAEASRSAVAVALGTPVVTTIRPAATFWPAGPEHQDFHRTNPVHYRSYRFGCGRDRQLARVWDGVVLR